MHRGQGFGEACLSLHDHPEQEKPTDTESAREKEIQSVPETAHIAPRNKIMGPKTAKRRSAFRRANRAMPRRRIDIAIEAIDYKNPDLLKKFVTESGKILPRRVTGMPAHLHRKITREIKRSRSVLLMK
jgi:small subunit ribosomal protein S18